MLVLTALAYPALLAALCLGAGLLVDRCSGEFLPGLLLPVVGAAGLIGVSQLTTDVPGLARATPYVLAAVAVAGFGLGSRRALELVRAVPTSLWQLGLPVAAYLVAVAPVLLAGRPTFSGYGALPDSALHMIGADYLIAHGQQYAHLDLVNSYGQYIHSYFDTSYPSGSHTLFGGSAALLGLPLIWALQPFCAFILATAAGPAWLLARRLGLTGGWAAAAALTATVPALVYGYELVASLKEVTTLPLILALGALVVVHDRWLRGPPTRAIPFALVAAAGVSALGLAFGPWVVAAIVVLAVLVLGDAAAGRLSLRQLAPFVAVGGLVGLVAAWPTWTDAAGSLQVATGIAATSNPGNLSTPLHAEQLLGSWLSGSYRHRAPVGASRVATYALVIVTGLAALIGVAHVIRSRAFVLGCWLVLLLALWLGLTVYGTTWTDAKLLMLTSPAAMLLAWGGVAGLRASPLGLVAPLAVALAIAAGVIASDTAQYHGNDVAPTARYDELASVNTRFAGDGPALFTDFDEWALYALRNLDVGGPDFIFRPVGLENVAKNHGDPVDLDRISPDRLLGYPLIVTRRDPTASRPPAAYRLAWEGNYYDVWTRHPGAPAAVAHVGLPVTRPIACSNVKSLARLAGSDGLQLVAARPVDLVRIDLGRALHPTWPFDHPTRVGLLMLPKGELTVSFALPHAGRWSLWLQGEMMPKIRVAVDGRPRESLVGEVSGNPFNPDTTPPLNLELAHGSHQLTVTRGGLTTAPGNGGSALLHAIFLTAAGTHEQLRVVAPARFRTLCRRRFDWIEATTGA